MTSNQGPPAANQAADQQVNEPSTTQDAAQAAQTQQSHVNLVHQLLDNLSLKVGWVGCVLHMLERIG